MNWAEFNAWLEAFGTDREVEPNQRQVDYIRHRMSQVVVDAPATTEQQFLDQYWTPYSRLEDGTARPLTWTTPEAAFSQLAALDREFIV